MNRLVSKLRNTVIQKDTSYYLDNIVIPSVEDYFDDVVNERKAFIAAILLFHTIDYLTCDCNKKYSLVYDQVNKFIEENNPNDAYALDLVRDVCDCAKHCHLTKRINDRIVDSVDSINNQDHEGFGLFNAPFSFSTFDNSGIYVRTKKESKLVPLEPAIRALYNALISLKKIDNN